MRLDPKRTLDELIASLAPDAGTRERALSNRIYHELSGAIAGSQEFSAVAKLYELDRDGSFDAIVLDTPPSRNALDFLDAPGRLLRFFEGRTVRMLLSQGGLATRVAGRASSPLLGVLARLTGGDVLREISAFITAIGSMIDGLAARAAAVSALLEDPATDFVLVSSPRREAVEEAIAFADALARAQIGIRALIVNRVRGDVAVEALDELEPLLGARLAALVRASVADLDALAGADRAALERLAAAFPALTPLAVPELPIDVHDLAGLRRVAGHLGYRVSSSSEPSPSAAP
jgi:anion-transporting  ArsA/GET3 family ATPase